MMVEASEHVERRRVGRDVITADWSGGGAVRWWCEAYNPTQAH